MNKEINLIQRPEEVKLTSESQVKKTVRLSILIILIVFLVMAGVFGYAFTLQIQKQTLDGQVAAKEKSINDMRDKEYLFRTYKLKINAANAILASREDLVPILNFIEETIRLLGQMTPNGIVLDTLSVPDLKTIRIVATAKDSNLLNDFISLLIEKDLQKYFKKVHLDSMIQSKDSGYNFSLTMTLNKDIGKQ